MSLIWKANQRIEWESMVTISALGAIQIIFQFFFTERLNVAGDSPLPYQLLRLRLSQTSDPPSEGRHASTISSGSLAECPSAVTKPYL